MVTVFTTSGEDVSVVPYKHFMLQVSGHSYFPSQLWHHQFLWGLCYPHWSVAGADSILNPSLISLFPGSSVRNWPVSARSASTPSRPGWFSWTLAVSLAPTPPVFVRQRPWTVYQWPEPYYKSYLSLTKTDSAQSFTCSCVHCTAWVFLLQNLTVRPVYLVALIRHPVSGSLRCTPLYPHGLFS